MNTHTQGRDCPVCLQKCHHPTQLPCGHIFCFLCAKGVAIQNRRCAMCRAEIPLDYLDHPVLLELSIEQSTTELPQEEYHWYYEGRNGWWKYDERSNIELETAFNAGNTECTLLLAGALYCINFQNMVQERRNDPTRRRHVRRDTPMLPAKGVAGIKNLRNKHSGEVKDQNETHSNDERLLLNVAETDQDVVQNENIDSVSSLSNEVNDITDALSGMNLYESQEPLEDSGLANDDT